jgi:hypothetical protein
VSVVDELRIEHLRSSLYTKLEVVEHSRHGGSGYVVKPLMVPSQQGRHDYAQGLGLVPDKLNK